MDRKHGPGCAMVCKKLASHRMKIRLKFNKGREMHLVDLGWKKAGVYVSPSHNIAHMMLMSGKADSRTRTRTEQKPGTGRDRT